MFYNTPDYHDLPDSAAIWIPSGGSLIPNFTSSWYRGSENGATGKLWLYRNKTGSFIPQDLKLVGVEGNEGLFTEKGANFEFTSDVEGTYRIEIPSGSGTNRVLTGVLVLGLNRVFWDGKDGSGNDISNNEISDVTIKLTGAEIHFPFIDVENNFNGIELRAMKADEDGNYTYVANGDYVYWNAPFTTALGTNPPPLQVNNTAPGKSSTTSNKNDRLWWGTNTNSGNNFGNDRAIVIWTYREGNESKQNFPLYTKSYDLEVSEINSSIISTSSPVCPQCNGWR